MKVTAILKGKAHRLEARLIKPCFSPLARTLGWLGTVPLAGFVPLLLLPVGRSLIGEDGRRRGVFVLFICEGLRSGNNCGRE